MSEQRLPLPPAPPQRILAPPARRSQARPTGQSHIPAVLLGLLVSTIASSASAHLRLDEPPARHPDTELKYGPCGIGLPDQRTTDPMKITTYTAGETIWVQWTEYIDHDPAHYRISISYGGDQDFVDPTGYDDIRTGLPVLLDGIPDSDGGSGETYAAEITLPNVPCEVCTLQVIQVMHDKQPWGGNDDIYYTCADITILPGPNAGTGGMGTGGVITGGTGGGNPSGTGGVFTTGGTVMDPGAGATVGTGGTMSTGGTGGLGTNPLQTQQGTSSTSGGCSLSAGDAARGASRAWMLLSAGLAFAGLAARRHRARSRAWR